MKKLALSAVATALLLGSVAFATAAETSPGHEMQKHGSKRGHPGASGYAPGHEMQMHGSKKGHPGRIGIRPRPLVTWALRSSAAAIDHRVGGPAVRPRFY